MPSSSVPFPASPAGALRGWLAFSAAVLIGLILPVAVMSYRAIPLFVGCILLLLILAGDARHVLQRLWARGDSRLLLALGLLLLWAAASLAWTLQPAPAAGVLGLVVLFVVLGALAWAADPDVPADVLALALGIGLAVASVLFLVETANDMALHIRFGSTHNPSKMNQAAILLLLWMWPVLKILADRWGRWPALALLALSGAAIMLSESDTARLALLVSLVGFALVRFGFRLLPALIGLGLALLIAVLPWLAAVMQSDLPPVIVKLFRSGHAAERLTIWTSFAYASGLKPFIGFGFNASGLIGFGPLISLFPENLWTGIRDSHPHNMFLQTWVELGGAGAALLALFLLRLGAIAAAVARPAAPFVAAVMAGAPVVALVGHGAWQAWWIAALSAVPVLFRLASASPARR